MDGKRSNAARLAALLVPTLIVSACASQPAGVSGEPGFFWGLFHGWVSLFTFVFSLFDDEVRIYAFPNSGRWCDFGFILGVMLFWGGGGGAAARSRRG